MKLVIVRHVKPTGLWPVVYTGATDVPLTANGRREASALPLLLEHILSGRRPVVVSSPGSVPLETAALALAECHLAIESLVAEYDYGDYEGLISEQIPGARPAGTSGPTDAPR